MSVWQGDAPIPLYTRAADPIFAQTIRKNFWYCRLAWTRPMRQVSAINGTASPLQADHPPQRPRRWLRWFLEVTGALLLFLTAAVVTDFAYFVSSLQNQTPSPAVKADGIIALTGGADRISEAFDLLNEGRAKRLLITGVNKSTSPNALAGHSAGGVEILDCCVDIDRNALNTLGNALETARWVRDRKFKSIIVVTSNYHMPRSLLELRRVLPDTTLIAYPVISQNLKLDSWWTDPVSIRLLLSEYVKYAGATFQLRVERATAEKITARNG
ncbi:YdcF family protein [Labrys neptuniae]